MYINFIKNQYDYEFNTISVIYEKSAETFIKPAEYFLQQRNKEKALEDDDELIEGPTEQVSKEELEAVKAKPQQNNASPVKNVTSNVEQEDILDMQNNQTTTTAPNNNQPSHPESIQN